MRFARIDNNRWLWLVLGCVLALPMAEGVTRLAAVMSGTVEPAANIYAYNALGMRGPLPNPNIPGHNRIVLIGDSVAMGWDVPEGQTLRAKISQKLGPNTDVITTGVPGANLPEAVAHWLSYNDRIAVGTVILVATLRAPGPSYNQKTHKSNFLKIREWLKSHSRLCATIVSMAWYQKLRHPEKYADANLHDTSAIYLPPWRDQASLQKMQAAMDILQADQKKRGYRVIMLIVPDLGRFHPYPAKHMHQILHRAARDRGWPYVDPLKALARRPANTYWALPNDHHPNAAAIGIMTDQLMPVLRSGGTS